MGEVYRAHDSKLGRDVAIKAMPPEFSRDPDRVSRFQREARMLASLNHPNIAAIHGLEESGGTQFLVLELVEGETLSEHIVGAPCRAPEKIDELLKIALQIAEALEAAHEKGIIHRDLKPANIKVTPEGKVKVLDFGLAKAFAGEQAEVNLSNSPTLSNTATQQGVILGTAAYMSPEQARGKPVDKRADIWAFGCVLFEMLTGRAAFSGRDVSEILASVIRSEPDWTKLPANLHWRIRELLERCLEKEVRNRYGSISDARVEIQKALADPSGALVQPSTTVEPGKRSRMMMWVASAVVLTAIMAGVAVWELKPPEPRQVMRFDYDLPEGQQFSDLNYRALAVSPDGRQIAYSTSEGLYIRSLDELTAKLISGTEGDTQEPFFSPDGKWIGFFSVTDGMSKKIPVNGGTPEVLRGVFRAAWWDKDNTIVSSRFADDIIRISANGRTPESVVKFDKSNSWTLTRPQILPDGKSILFSSISYDRQPKIMLRSLKSGEIKEVFPGYEAQYLPTGHIVFLLPNKGSLFAIPFNLERLEVKGEALPVLEGVKQYAVSDAGTLAYLRVKSGEATAGKTLVWVNREGKEEPLTAPPNEYWFFRISPDGNRVALSVIGMGKAYVSIWDVVRGGIMPLTFKESPINAIPLWTPDGKRIVYASSGENPWFGDISWRAADGTGEAEKLVSLPGHVLSPWSWSKDGKHLLLLDTYQDQYDIGLLSMDGNHARKPLLQEKYSLENPRVSHDGRWIAYASKESGKYEVYVRPFPDVNRGRCKVSTNGGDSPLWSPDDRELFYRSGDAAMAVRVDAEPTFEPGKPTVLFRTIFPGVSGVARPDMTYWDISPDGKRFLMLKENPAAAPRKINLVVNWFEELKLRLPKR